ncbi:MAG: hypothetical protein JW952_05965 [Candidatus Eisenbacteria bacterium]|nr:hypothetical protein [Candidatus Eisenbacteria bacterium]
MRRERKKTVAAGWPARLPGPVKAHPAFLMCLAGAVAAVTSAAPLVCGAEGLPPAVGDARTATVSVPVRAWDDSTEAAVRSVVLESYGRRGYLGATVDSVVLAGGPEGRTAVVHVSEGRPAVAGEVRFVGNRTVPSDRLSDAAGIVKGTRLADGVIQRARDNVVSFLADAGLPFAQVRAAEFRLDGSAVSFAFLIDEGPVARVSEVRLAGSNDLKPGPLERALGVRRGDLYNMSKLRHGVTALRRSGLFQEVGEPSVTRSGDDCVTISIPVKDKKTTSFAGAMGFRGRTSEVTGALSLSVLNLARSGRSASAGWEASGNKTSSLRFLYTEPWVSGLPFSSTVSFDHTARDTFFAKTSFTISAKVPVWRGLSGEVGASFEKTLNTAEWRSRATRTAWLAGVELFMGEASWLSRGTLLTSLEFSRGRRKLVCLDRTALCREDESRAFSTLRGEALVQGRVRRGQLLVLDASVSAVLEGTELISSDEMFPLGGKNTLRGYSERQFQAETVGSLQCEYGLVVGDEGGRAFVFLDCGYASTPAASRAERFHYGYGIGLRVPSLLGLAGIDLGIPAGESLSSGKVHVGLEARF